MTRSKFDYNYIVSLCEHSNPVKEFSADDILKISQDFEEGIEYEYLIVRLHLLNLIVYEPYVREVIWKLIGNDLLALTVDRKLQFIQKKD